MSSKSESLNRNAKKSTTYKLLVYTVTCVNTLYQKSATCIAAVFILL